MSTEKKQFEIFLGQFEEACLRAKRNPNEVEILPVSKGQSVEKIQRFLAIPGFPQRLAENYLQELVSKASQIKVEWHYQGAVQSRKIPEIARVANVIQSISRIKELQILSELNVELPFFLQVNLSAEGQKLGASWEETKELLDFAAKKSLNCAGLMGVASAVSEAQGEKEIRKEFAALRAFRDRELPAGKLSMGMSSDYALALLEGADVIRVGSSIFGERVYPR